MDTCEVINVADGRGVDMLCFLFSLKLIFLKTILFVPFLMSAGR